jgi:hypothetical protein
VNKFAPGEHTESLINLREREEAESRKFSLGSIPRNPANAVQLVNNIDYLETINAPLSFIGCDRETGKQLCRFEWDANAELFRMSALTPTENKWSQEMAASVYEFLDRLNANREELTRPVRIRPAE